LGCDSPRDKPDSVASTRRRNQPKRRERNDNRKPRSNSRVAKNTPCQEQAITTQANAALVNNDVTNLSKRSFLTFGYVHQRGGGCRPPPSADGDGNDISGDTYDQPCSSLAQLIGTHSSAKATALLDVLMRDKDCHPVSGSRYQGCMLSLARLRYCRCLLGLLLRPTHGNYATCKRRRSHYSRSRTPPSPGGIQLQGTHGNDTTCRRRRSHYSLLHRLAASNGMAFETPGVNGKEGNQY
jgi:hypothetical protein